MHRIDTTGSIKGAFSDGDSTGPEPKPGTVIDAAWLNGFQEALCGFVERQGVELKKGDASVLEKAIVALFEKSILFVNAEVAALNLEIQKIREEIGKR